jgi:hypothetical protein
VQSIRHDLDMHWAQNRGREIVLSIRRSHRLIPYSDAVHYTNLSINNTLDKLKETLHGRVQILYSTVILNIPLVS